MVVPLPRRAPSPSGAAERVRELREWAEAEQALADALHHRLAAEVRVEASYPTSPPPPPGPSREEQQIRGWIREIVALLVEALDEEDEVDDA